MFLNEAKRTKKVENKEKNEWERHKDNGLKRPMKT